MPGLDDDSFSISQAAASQTDIISELSLLHVIPDFCGFKNKNEIIVLQLRTTVSVKLSFIY